MCGSGLIPLHGNVNLAPFENRSRQTFHLVFERVKRTRHPHGDFTIAVVDGTDLDDKIALWGGCFPFTIPCHAFEHLNNTSYL